MNRGGDDYTRIKAALEWLAEHAMSQPTLRETASAAGMSTHHFQRVFSRWAGVSPKRYLQVLTVERAKKLLLAGQPALDTAHGVGLSGGSRLHDHFVSLEAATPGEFGSGGQDLSIRCGVAGSPFGTMLVAATPRGISRLEFADSNDAAALENFTAQLHAVWPRAAIVRDDAAATRLSGRIFSAVPNQAGPVSLYVHGTNFQVAVWRALLRIPPAGVTTYGNLADAVAAPGAARAVGSAVAANPVGFLIPCHRVIRGTGELGGFRWGPSRKRAIHSWEAARHGAAREAAEAAP